MNPQREDDDAAELLDADRELTPDEQSRIRRIGEAGWRSLQSLLTRRAKNSYSVASQGDFTTCVFQHMNPDQRTTMISAEIYFCPACSRLLKDRGSTAASSVLIERNRIRKLWLDVEQAPPDQTNDTLNRFRRALEPPP